MNKIKKPRKNTFSIIFLLIFAIALIAQHWVFTPFAQAAVNISQGWEGDYSWSGKNIVLTTANGSITFSLDSSNGNDVNFSAKKWLDSVYQNRLGQNSPTEEDLHISLIKGDDPRQGKLWCRYISTYAVETKMLPSACAVNSSNDYLSGNIEIKNAQQGDTDLNKELGLKGCPPQKKKDGDKNYACLGGGAVVNGKYDKNGKPPEDPTRTGEDDGDNQKDQSSACEAGAGAFGWILCKVVDVAEGIYSWFVGLVNSILFFESDKFDNNQLEQSWRIFANLASGLILLFALLMIVSQIFSFEVLDAYTVKKVLPRIVIGAIAIQLSWFIFTTIIQISNALGNGVYWLILAPFSGDIGGAQNYVELTNILGSGVSNDTFLSDTIQTVVLVGGLAVGVWSIVSLTALGIIISIFIAIITIILREILIILLLVLSPIAIAFWIFPGTKKWWDSWWSSFSKLLLMYPMIMGLFAAGAISAYIIVQSGGSYSKLLATIAYFAPMFLIGATFKFAGSAMRGLSNITTSYGKKYGDMAAKGTQGAARNATGRLARNHNSAFTRGLNYASHGAIVPGRLGAGGRARAAADAKKSISERDQNMNTLVEAQLAGKSHGEREAALSELANGNNNGMAEAALRTMAAESLWGPMGRLDNTGRARIRAMMDRDPQSDFSGAVWKKRRDLAGGKIEDMSDQDLAMSHDSMFDSANNPLYSQVDSGVDQDTRNRIRANPQLFGVMGQKGQDFMGGSAAGVPNPQTAPITGSPAGGGVQGTQPAQGGNVNSNPASGTPARVRFAGPTGQPASANSVINDLSAIGNGDIQHGTRQLSDNELQDAWSHARANKWHKDRGGATTTTERAAAGIIAQEMNRRGFL